MQHMRVFSGDKMMETREKTSTDAVPEMDSCADLQYLSPAHLCHSLLLFSGYRVYQNF